MKLPFPTILCSFVVSLSVLTLSAAPVTFAQPVTITGDHDVITTGVLAQGINFGGPDTTVNGVLFSAGRSSSGLPSVDFGSTKIVASSNCIVVLNDSPTCFAGEGDVFASLSTPYKALLGSGAYSNQTTGTLTLTIAGLTKGKSYTAQFFVDDSRDFHGGNRHETISSAGTVSQSIDYSSTGTLGGVGQYVIATFTADGPTQDFTFTPIASTDDAQLNGFQLRTTP